MTVSLTQSAGVCAERCQIRASAINHPDAKFMIQNYSSAVISTEYHCANITSNACENEEVKTSDMCGVNNYADCLFSRLKFMGWRIQERELVALGYNCPPANQTSACECVCMCVCVSVLCDSIIMRLAAGYHRPITDVYRSFGRGNLSMSRLQDTHTYTRRVHTV